MSTPGRLSNAGPGRTSPVITPDGICLDADGALWYADVGGRRCVRVREGGAVLQMVDTDLGCFACMLGGTDGTTLFIVAKLGPCRRT